MCFNEFKAQNYAFVDKTIFIKTLEELSTSYPILLRPRRFGKSTFIVMLKYFYDQAYQNLYKEIFESTAIYNENLSSHNSYHVLSLDFSGISAITYDEIKKAFGQKIKAGVVDFMQRYPDFTFDKKNEYEDPAQYILEFFLSYQDYAKDQKKLYIMIDEYDNFANEILNSNPSLFKEITHSAGFVKGFYSQIKDATKSVVKKTFITGVSSVSLDSLTSGFNIAQNITTLKSFNEYAGMTEKELRKLVCDLVDYQALGLELDYLISAMKQTYNGYAFSKNASQKLFNTSMCLKYIAEIVENGRFVDPNRVIDPNCNFDPQKLYDVMKNTDPSVLEQVFQTYFDEQPFEITNIAESININQIEQYDYDTVISILFYLGYLTIKPSYELEQYNENLSLVCPNKVIRKIFRKCFFTFFTDPQKNFLKSFAFDLDCIKNNQDDLTPFIQSCENYLGARLSHQHLLRMTELYLVGLIKTKLEAERYLVTKDEFPIQVPGIDEKFVDLYIENQAKNIYIIEFKYISKSALAQNPTLIEHKAEEARKQLMIYREATCFKNTKLKAYIVIFVDCKCFHYEQI